LLMCFGVRHPVLYWCQQSCIRIFLRTDITNPFRLPVISLEFVVVQLCQCCCGASGWQHRTRLEIVQGPGRIRSTRIFAIVAVSVVSISFMTVSESWEYLWRLYRPCGARLELVGGGGRSDGGVLIMSWKLSSVAGSFDI
jgi:hypothetical protein